MQTLVSICIRRKTRKVVKSFGVNIVGTLLVYRALGLLQAFCESAHRWVVMAEQKRSLPQSLLQREMWVQVLPDVSQGCQVQLFEWDSHRIGTFKAFKDSLVGTGVTVSIYRCGWHCVLGIPSGDIVPNEKRYNMNRT